MDVQIIFGVIGGAILGGVIMWLIASNRVRKESSNKSEELQGRVNVAEGKVSAFEATLNSEREQSKNVREEAANDFKALREKLSLEEQARVKAETEKNEAISKLEEEKALLKEAREELSKAFKALASDALNTNSEQFLTVAKTALETLVAEAKGDLGQRQTAIEGLVNPLSKALEQYQEQLQNWEKNNLTGYTTLDAHIKSLAGAQQQLQIETGNLVTALKTPQVSGQWGQMLLERVLELSGMTEHRDFSKQVTVEAEDGKLRPDVIVHLPSNRNIVVDAKVSIASYLDALAAKNEEEKEEFLRLHAAHVRTHMNNLGAKAYWEQFDQTPNIVVMFIPGESLLAEAAHYDHRLFEDGMQKRVLIASPTILFAILCAVAYGWSQEQIAKNAQAISDLGKQLHNRMRILAEHIIGIGDGLEKATSSYNNSIGSLEHSVLPQARRFKDLGVSSGEEIPVLEQIETTIRALNAPEASENNPKSSS